MQAVKVYNMREVDELVFLDISASIEGREPDFETVDEIADECFMPLTVGGGVRSVEDVRRLLQVGADKVAINTAAVENPDLIGAVAAEFGSQCVVASIDARCVPKAAGPWRRTRGPSPPKRIRSSLAEAAEARGAGEILITSIDRDGTMSGYDLELTRSVAEAVSIPVIASGGAGSYEDMAYRTHSRQSRGRCGREHVPLHRADSARSEAVPRRARDSGAVVSGVKR